MTQHWSFQLNSTSFFSPYGQTFADVLFYLLLILYLNYVWFVGNLKCLGRSTFPILTVHQEGIDIGK